MLKVGINISKFPLIIITLNLMTGGDILVAYNEESNVSGRQGNISQMLTIEGD
jgi:hypothetical protein